MKINRRNPGHWLLLAVQSLCTLLVIAVRPMVRKPEKPLVLLYGHQLSGNLKALYDEWQSSYRDRLDLYFLSLDSEHAGALRKDGVPVLSCSRPGDMLQLTRASAMITDHGLHAMSPLLRFTDIRFIDVWHGIPFKGFTADDFKLQHRYDEVWVSSPLLKEIYEERFGFPAGIVKDLGYARVDKLFANKGRESSLGDRLDIAHDKKVVLFAPTWQQDKQGRNLFPFGESPDSFIDALERVCTEHSAVLIIRSHLNASIEGPSRPGVVYCSMADFPDTEDLLLRADVLICDWSSIAFDFLALRRTTLFLDVPPPFRNSFSLGPEYRFGTVVADTGELTGKLEVYLADPQAYVEENGERISAIIGELYAENTSGTVSGRQLQHLHHTLTTEKTCSR